MKYTKEDLIKAKQFKGHSLILNDVYSKTISGSYMMRYQARFYTSNILDEYLLNFKVNNNKPDFANSISNFSGEYAKASLKSSILEEKNVSGKIITLPKATQLKGSLEGALLGRKSIRSYSKNVMDIQDLSNILFHSLSASSEHEEFRFYPRKYGSGGGFYPIYLYLIINKVAEIPPGIYKYQPFSHNLLKVNDFDCSFTILSNVDGIDIDNASFMGLWVYDKRKNSLKYGDLALVLSLIEVGEAMQTFNLVSYYYGVGSCELGGYQKQICEKELCLDGLDSHVVGCFTTGYSI